MVVDFAVEDEDVTAARGGHRLPALHRQIDDREPPVAERDAGLRIDPHALPVRPAMREARRHARKRAARCLLIEGDAIQKAVDSAHWFVCPVDPIRQRRRDFAARRPADGRAILRRNKSAIIPARNGAATEKTASSGCRTVRENGRGIRTACAARAGCDPAFDDGFVRVSRASTTRRSPI
jgi:hypothetical protein